MIIQHNLEFKKFKDYFYQLAEKHLGNFCQGVFVYGSFFTNDFDELTSDIDFAAFLNKPISDDIIQHIREFHLEFCSVSKYAKLLEGDYLYLDCDKIWDSHPCVSVNKNQPPHLDSGAIDPDTIEYIRNSGISVFGGLLQHVIPYASKETISSYFQQYFVQQLALIHDCKENPSDYWHKILNICRAFYYIENGTLLREKRLSALWFLKRYPQHKQIVEKALCVRSGKAEATISPQERDAMGDLVKDVMMPPPVATVEKCGFYKPMRIEIQTTTKCNCNCPHCGYSTINNSIPISVPTIVQFMEEVQNVWGWVDRVLFEGGEPTLEFENLISCVFSAKKLNIPNIQINTNMIDLSEADVIALCDAGCNYIEVSVDAVREDLWLKMRGLPNNRHGHKRFQDFMKTLSFACSLPYVTVDFNFTPTKVNFEELGDAYDLACHLGAKYFSFQSLVCTTENIRRKALTAQQLMYGLRQCLEIAKKYACPSTILLCCLESLLDVQKEDIRALTDEPFLEDFLCPCGNSYVYLNSKKELRLCCFGSGLKIGDYEFGNFNKIWLNKQSVNGSICPVIRF